MVLLPLPGGPASASLCLLSTRLYLAFNLSLSLRKCPSVSERKALLSLFFVLVSSTFFLLVCDFPHVSSPPPLLGEYRRRLRREPGFSFPAGGGKAPTGGQWIPCETPELSPPLAAMTIPPPWMPTEAERGPSTPTTHLFSTLD